MLADVQPIKPFPYQARGIARTIGKFEKGTRSTVCVFATGTGKTILGGYVARWGIEEKGGRVLWLAHRDLLIQQAVDDLLLCGVESAIEKADLYARGQSLYGEPSCVVASVQTMRGNRLDSWPADYFNGIIVDEAHHCTAGSYRRILDYFAWDWHLGLTATPDRADGENLGQVYQSVADEFNLRDAVDGGWLARPRVVRCESDIDLSALSTRGKDDFSDDDLEALMRPHVGDLANSIKQEIGDRPTLVFTPGVKSAEGMASALSSIGVACHSISGDTKNRDEIWDDFRSHRVQAVANCNLATEGANFPFVSAVALARPTKSRALYSQMVGRGTRKYPGKDDCLIIDFAFVTGSHKLVQPTELFDTTHTHKEVQEIAREIIETGETDDLMEAIARAETEHQKRAKLRIEVAERRVRYRRVSYDPLSVMDVLDIPVREEAAYLSAIPATHKQLALLQKLGVQGAERMSKSRASKVLDGLMSRMDAGLATHKQVAHLIVNGVDQVEARAMTRKEASARLSDIFGKHRSA